MTFSPALPPIVITILAVVGVVSLVVPLVDGRSTLPRGRLWAVVALRAVVVAALVLILANPVAQREVETRHKPGTVAVLRDASASMTLGEPTRRQQLPAWTAPLAAQETVPVRLYDFAERARQGTAEVLPEAGSETRLGQAILDVLESETTELRDVIILSDGRDQDAQTLTRALAACGQRQVRVSTAVVGTRAPLYNLAIHRCVAPVRAISRSVVPVEVVMHAVLPADLEEVQVPLEIVDGSGEVRASKEVRLLPGRNTHQLELPLAIGSEAFTVRVQPQPEELTADDNAFDFSVEVTDPRIRVLYMEGSNHSARTRAGELHETQFMTLAWDAEGDIDAEVLVNDEQMVDEAKLYGVKGFTKDSEAVYDKSRGFPRSRADLYRYDVVICSDISRANFTDEQLQWVVDLVLEEGGGFCMIGGYTAFDSGGWDKTVWEKVIPVDMAAYGRGHNSYSIQPRFPKTVLSHPILQFTDDPEINEAILAIHPRFLGFHMIERAKPGATVLAESRYGTPLIAVQQYGRGRAMAFLSDAAGGWGDRYQNYWGPQYLPYPARQAAATRGVEISDPPDSLAGQIGNRFYNQFWVNTIRWLAENARGRGDGVVRVELVKTTASPGETIGVTARVITDEAALPGEVAVKLAETGETVMLQPAGTAGHYRGELTIPAKLAAGEHRLTATVVVNDKEETASAPVRIERYNREFADPDPDIATMQRIAAVTGGSYLRTPQDLAAVLKGVDPGKATAVTVTVPLWDRWWLWGSVVLAFSLAWLLPKLS